MCNPVCTHGCYIRRNTAKEGEKTEKTLSSCSRTSFISRSLSALAKVSNYFACLPQVLLGNKLRQSAYVFLPVKFLSLMARASARVSSCLAAHLVSSSLLSGTALTFFISAARGDSPMFKG